MAIRLGLSPGPLWRWARCSHWCEINLCVLPYILSLRKGMVGVWWSFIFKAWLYSVGRLQSLSSKLLYPALRDWRSEVTLFQLLVWGTPATARLYLETERCTKLAPAVLGPSFASVRAVHHSPSCSWSYYRSHLLFTSLTVPLHLA